MVINLLDSKDLLELSLLKCKVCSARLQSPVLQVGVFGNVCGTCYSTTVYTDAVRNVDLEALLQKLYLPCNYAEQGCDFEGSFDEVCAHEKRCFFLRKNCPLAERQQCETGLTDSDDIIAHMKSEHPDNVLSIVDGYISVKNPFKSDVDRFYLLVVDKMTFILQARFDTDKKVILYKFYSLNYCTDIEHVKMAIMLKFDETIFTVDNIQIERLRKGELPYLFNDTNATKLQLALLESLNSLDNIIIRVNTDECTKFERTSDQFWYQCFQCLTYSPDIIGCSYCKRPSRGSCCDTDRCKPKCYCENSDTLVCLSAAKITTKSIIPCRNIGCNYKINSADYKLHVESQCRFRECGCPFCPKWQGISIDLGTHITREHAERVNRNSIRITTGTSSPFCFMKNNDVFMQTYEMWYPYFNVTTEQLHTPNNGDSYMWQIYFKHPIKKYETVISDVCAGDNCNKTIDISDYANEDTLTVKVLFARINAVHI